MQNTAEAGTPTLPRRDARLLPLVLIGAALLLVLLLGIRTVSSSDIWLHLAAGRHALQQGPARIDPFSFSLPVATPWTQTTWLYDILVFALWTTGGSGMAVVFHAVAVTGAFLLLLPVARRYAGDLATAAALLFCAWLLAPLFTMRPTLLSLPFMAVALRLTLRPELERHHVALLLVNQILWVNMAPWFVLGPFMMILRTAEAFRTKPAPDAAAPSASPARPASFLALAGLLTVACIATPFGAQPLLDTLAGLLRLEPPVTLEWISPFARDFLPYPLAALSTLALVLIACVFIFHRSALPLVVTALAVIATFQIVQSNHHIDMNALMIFPFIAMSFTCLVHLARSRLAGNRGERARLVATVLLFATALGSLVAVITNRYYIASGSASAFGLGVNTDAYPVAATEVLSSLKRKPSRMLNLSHDGGYLLWRMPGTRVFADPRGELYGTRFFDVLSRGLVGDEPSWNELISRYDPDALLIHGTWTGAGATAFRLLQGDQWAMAYFDGATLLIVRTTSSNAELLGHVEARKRGLALIRQNLDRYARHIHNRFVRPPNPSRLIGAASTYQALGRFDDALPLHLALTRGTPRYVKAWVNQGIAELEKDQIKDAVATFEHVVQLIPDSPIGWLWLGQAYQRDGRHAEATDSHDTARSINRLVAERFISEQAPREPSAP